MASVSIREETAAELSRGFYNAHLTEVKEFHDDLRIFRVRPDRGVPDFQAGQYTVLGLGYWERRVEDVQPETLDEGQQHKIVKRAYSICCPMIDATGMLVRGKELPYLEFLITLVRRTASRAPALTPRLFGLQAGDRLYCGPHVHGHYTLHRVFRDDHVIFAATGTGEAPHNCMVAELLATGHRGRIVSVVCVRWKQDLAYLHAHRILERQYPNYRYVVLTTREPENIDPAAEDFIGKRYLQEYFQSGDLERETGLTLSPEECQVFLCGSPEMIGVPHRTHDPAKRYPEPIGMVEVLEERGFRVDQPHQPGNVHFEKYW